MKKSFIVLISLMLAFIMASCSPNSGGNAVDFSARASASMMYMVTNATDLSDYISGSDGDMTVSQDYTVEELDITIRKDSKWEQTGSNGNFTTKFTIIASVKGETATHDVVMTMGNGTATVSYDGSGVNATEFMEKYSEYSLLLSPSIN